MAPVRPEDLVFLDETGSHLGYTPTYARAPRGQRAYATAPANRGENKTVVAALTLDGIGPRLRFDGAMTTPRFEGYVRFFLAPTLRPGQVVVLMPGTLGSQFRSTETARVAVDDLRRAQAEAQVRCF